MHEALSTFITAMDDLVATTEDPHAIAEGTAQRLAPLLAAPEFLEDRYRVGDADEYRQHVVHVHPEGRYSIVALVWQPGQSTPVHDHRCWCVVGVLEGREKEARFTLHAEEGQEWLVEREGSFYDPGDVCQLVPPHEDIHRVGNATADQRTISMHIYGADIATVGTSINRTFDLPVRGSDAADGRTRISWRADDDHELSVAARAR